MMHFSTLGLLASSVFTAHYASAASEPVFFFTQFPMTSTAMRDELITRMDNISRWSCTNEPGVSKYALLIPRGGGDNLTAYSIEQYNDDDTFNTHLAAPIVASSLFAWSTANKVFSADPTVQNFTVLPNMSFTTTRLLSTPTPYVLITSQTYQPAGMHHVIEHLGEEVEASRDESGTLAFGLYTDPTNKNKVWTMGVWESEEYWRTVHKESQTAKEVEEHTAGMKTGKGGQWILEKRGGFLGRGEGVCG